MKISTGMVCAAAVFATATITHAQHSYLPAQNASGEIHTFVDPDGEDGNTPFLPDRVVVNEFNTALVDGVFRAGGPSAFAKDAGDAAFGDIPGFGPLTPNTDLTLTMPILSQPSFGATGNFLYWDGSGAAPSFGGAPANVSIAIGSEQDSVLTPLATLDGSNTVVSLVEDTTNANGGRSGHFHLRYDVVGVDPNTSANVEAPDGIYLLAHSVGQQGLAASDPVFVALMKNPDLDQGLLNAFTSAINFIETTVVPEPASGLILAAAASGIAMIGRRRKIAA